MRINTDALIIRVADTGESDRVVTLLTRNYGIIRAFANGSKKIKSKLHSRTQLLCYSTVSVYQSRDSYIIDDAQDIEVFFGLRENIEKLSLAQYFCELALELAPEFEPADSYLRLILNALHLLEKDKRPQALIKAAYELRILCLSGYMPDLEGCSSCGKEDSPVFFFSGESGSLRCASCPASGCTIGRGTLTAMRYICSSGIDKVYNFTLPDQSLHALSEAAEMYTLAQTRRQYKSLGFYKALFPKA